MTATRVPLFDGVELQLLSPLATAETQAALHTFLALSPPDRAGLSRHVVAYAQDVQEWTGDETPLDLSPDGIWSHVHPRVLAIETDAHSPRHETYVVVEADCDWEPEHGLMLCFREGRTLTKCGGFDGHLTNVNALNDPRLADVVYRALDPRFTTRLAP